MALTAYVDDSGSGGDSPYYVLGGYLSTVSEWELFTQEWDAALRTKPSIEYFKSAEAEALDGQFQLVLREIKDYKINKLLEIIQKHVLQCVTSTMRQSDYNEIVKSRITPEWDNPYYFCFMGMVGTCALFDKHFGYGEPIDFVFDTQEGLENHARRLYGDFQRLPMFRDHVGNIDFRDDKQFLPLQAADLVSWQARRHWCHTKEPSRPHFITAKTLQRPPIRARLKKQHIRMFMDILDGRATQIGGDLLILADGLSLDGLTLDDLKDARRSRR
jgi:hypothetical protein